jgi:hypothetical protein
VIGARGDNSRGEWNEGASDRRANVLDGKEGESFGTALHPHFLPPHAGGGGRGYEGVKITIYREVDHHGRQGRQLARPFGLCG